MIPSADEFKDKYIRYADFYLEQIRLKYSYIADDIFLKKSHGLSMLDGVRNTTIKSGLFNDSYFLSSAFEGCFHDIGRFKQYLLCGTLKDNKLEEILSYKDHGKYGRDLLLENNKRLLRYINPFETNYDHIFTEVIGEHTNIDNVNYIIDIDKLTNIFKEYSLDDVLKSNREDLINKLIAIKLKILQEVDSLELINNVINLSITPKLISDKSYNINDKIIDDFINFRYIDMKKYKEMGIWNCNAGFLLRLSLLFNKINLVCTLKNFYDNNLLDKYYESSIINIDESIIDFKTPIEYSKVAIMNLINESDGILISSKTRDRALEKTLKECNYMFDKN